MRQHHPSELEIRVIPAVVADMLCRLKTARRRGLLVLELPLWETPRWDLGRRGPSPGGRAASLAGAASLAAFSILPTLRLSYSSLVILPLFVFFPLFFITEWRPRARGRPPLLVRNLAVVYFKLQNRCQKRKRSGIYYMFNIYIELYYMSIHAV